MTDILDILRDWHVDASKSNPEEADFIKKIIDEISSLRYLNHNPGKHLSVSDWIVIDDAFKYAQHKNKCSYIYGRCNCKFFERVEKYQQVRNAQRDEQTNEPES